jgi:hypothetical protein
MVAIGARGEGARRCCRRGLSRGYGRGAGLRGVGQCRANFLSFTPLCSRRFAAATLQRGDKGGVMN